MKTGVDGSTMNAVDDSCVEEIVVSEDDSSGDRVFDGVWNTWPRRAATDADTKRI
jgi:hypothetical protein